LFRPEDGGSTESFWVHLPGPKDSDEVFWANFVDGSRFREADLNTLANELAELVSDGGLEDKAGSEKGLELIGDVVGVLKP
jgi:hypothetical protein